MSKEIIDPEVVKDFMKRLSVEPCFGAACNHDVAFGDFRAVGHKGSRVYFNAYSKARDLTEMRLKNGKVVLSLYRMKVAGEHWSYHSQVFMKNGDVTFYRGNFETPSYILVTEGDGNEDVAVKLAEALLCRTRKLIG
jgi:hypothetical protein